MSNNNVPGSNQNVNVQVRTLTTDPNVTSQYKTKILHKNVVNGVNTLTQAMMNDINTKYVIKYDYVLGEDITVPANCVLEFDGGSISASGSNDTITGSNTGISAGLVKIFNTNVILAGSWNVVEAYPEWFGAKGDGVTDDATSITKCLIFGHIISSVIIFSNRTYYTSTSLPLFRNSKIIGSDTTLKGNASIIFESSYYENNIVYTNISENPIQHYINDIRIENITFVNYTTAIKAIGIIEKSIICKCFFSSSLQGEEYSGAIAIDIDSSWGFTFESNIVTWGNTIKLGKHTDWCRIVGNSFQGNGGINDSSNYVAISLHSGSFSTYIANNGIVTFNIGIYIEDAINNLTICSNQFEECQNCIKSVGTLINCSIYGNCITGTNIFSTDTYGINITSLQYSSIRNNRNPYNGRIDFTKFLYIGNGDIGDNFIKDIPFDAIQYAKDNVRDCISYIDSNGLIKNVSPAGNDIKNLKYNPKLTSNVFINWEVNFDLNNNRHLMFTSHDIQAIETNGTVYTDKVLLLNAYLIGGSYKAYIKAIISGSDVLTISSKRDDNGNVIPISLTKSEDPNNYPGNIRIVIDTDYIGTAYGYIREL